MSSEPRPHPAPGPQRRPRQTQDAAAAEGPPAREPFTLTDPVMMRALAHPVRMSLLELFAVHDTLTATQASEALGESPANCAFHLRTLAKYGLVEEAGGGRGRERPWRAKYETIDISPAVLEGEQTKVAARALSQAFVGRWLASISSALTADAWPSAWEEAVTATHSVLFLTPAEAAAVNEEMNAILARYRHRREDLAARPAGSLPVEYSFFGYPSQDLSASLSVAEPERPDAAASPGESHEPR